MATATTTAPTLADLARSWAIALHAQGKAPATCKSYAYGLAAFTKWVTAAGATPTVASLDRATAQLFLSDLRAAGAAPASIRAKQAALKQFAKWMEAEGETDTDVLLGLTAPTAGKPHVKALTNGEVDALITACKAPRGAGPAAQFEACRDEALIRLLADTGARAGEVVNLTTDDVDLTRRIARVTRSKNGRARVASFGPDTARALDRWLRRGRRGHRLAGTPALWLGGTGRTFGYSGLRGAVRRRAARAGLHGVHPHQFRHYAASRALAAGVPAHDVLTQFGWSNAAMLQVYTWDSAQERATAAFQKFFDEQGQR